MRPHKKMHIYCDFYVKQKIKFNNNNNIFM